MGIETHLIISRAGEMTLSYETDFSPKFVKSLASVCYSRGDVGAAISSGSFLTCGMLILPCSIRTAGEIAWGGTSSLLTRAADVVLKERRTLVLGVRETPLHAGHLHTMLRLTECGGIVAPIMPAFYSRPKTLDDLIDHTVGRMLDLFGIHVPGMKRWGELAAD
jgi:4-hydroxy-3-polyprenylbenzoate decarboxylase